VSEALIKHCNERLAALRTARTPWWNHWREIADYLLPRRYRWLVTPNDPSRGASTNNKILDSTATVAHRVLGSGMMSGITSPSVQWFKLTVPDSAEEQDQSNPVTRWLAEVQQRMLRVMSESNFYPAMAQLYMDLGGFGTACGIIYEDYDDVIRCYNPCAGEYYFANSSKGKVDTVAREFTMTIRQMIQEFGKEALSDQLQAMAADDRGGQMEQEISIGHLIEPNVGGDYPVAKRFKWRETYWEVGRERERVLRSRGFNEFPALCPRWDLVGNDAYGSSPAMVALGDIKQLQQETKRKAQAIDKMVNPPLMADVQLKNQPASVLPGGVTYINNLATNAGMKPIYTVLPPVQELMQDIKEIQERIKVIFFNDLFMMFQNLQAEPRSAAAVDARREEKLVMLGPVLERFENEALDPAIDRIFGIMLRGGLLPPPPPELHGAFVKVQYVSMLAEAQRATGTAAIERVLATAGNLAGVDPTAMDVINVQECLQEYALLLAVNPKLIRSDAEVLAIQQKRAQDAQAQQAMQAGMAAVQGAKTLSQTDVGGGINALQAMTGGGTIQ
jgi:hypothetical protein